MAHLISEVSSFKEKYQWPEAAEKKFETSPCIQTKGKFSSRIDLALLFISDTEIIS